MDEKTASIYHHFLKPGTNIPVSVLSDLSTCLPNSCLGCGGTASCDKLEFPSGSSISVIVVYFVL